MNMQPSPPKPAKGQSGVSTQVAALCWRLRKGVVEVLLITSRETGRWVIPKGWPIAGLTASDAAAREAWEEAGVRGQVRAQPLGLYLYDKVTGPSEAKRCSVAVFGLRVDDLKNRYPEAGQRRRAWFTPGAAAGLVAEPDLRDLLAGIGAEPGLLTAT